MILTKDNRASLKEAAEVSCKAQDEYRYESVKGFAAQNILNLLADLEEVEAERDKLKKLLADAELILRSLLKADAERMERFARVKGDPIGELMVIGGLTYIEARDKLAGQVSDGCDDYQTYPAVTRSGGRTQVQGAFVTADFDESDWLGADHDRIRVRLVSESQPFEMPDGTEQEVLEFVVVGNLEWRELRKAFCIVAGESEAAK